MRPLLFLNLSMGKKASHFMIRISFLGVFLLFINWSCNNGSKMGTKLRVNVLHARDKTIYLDKLSLTGDREPVDSAKLASGDATVDFNIKEEEERPFLIRISGGGFLIYVINDVPEILVKVNIIKPREYIVEGSPANGVLRQFENEQQKIVEQTKSVSLAWQEATRNGNRSLASQLSDSLNKMSSTYYDLPRKFADTVSSPGVFLKIYNQIDFGKDYKFSKAFITRASERFPDHSLIQQLKEKVFASVKVFEVEYNVGDELPSVKLPDTAGRSFNTALTRGKYVFIDLWSTWCTPCLVYDKYKKEAVGKFPADKFEVVSIGLDPEREQWRQYIWRNGLRWTQLNDEAVWDGEAINRLMVDSIPFNFLLAPDGKILRKAIPADSVIGVLSGYIR